jgi:hypothetical protein
MGEALVGLVDLKIWKVHNDVSSQAALLDLLVPRGWST